MNMTDQGLVFTQKMKEVGYADCSDPSGYPRQLFEGFLEEYSNNKDLFTAADQNGIDPAKCCAALAQLKTIKTIGACNNGPYDVRLFWDMSVEEYEAFLKCCPDDFKHLELISFYESLELIRAEHEWQKTGAYSVRIQGMNRQYHIPLEEEFDEHDFGDTRYIVGLYDGFPIATCRFYETEPGKVILGRLVVLPEYRNRHAGIFVVGAAEEWIRELGYKEIIIDSRIEAVPFYEKAGFVQMSSEVIKSGSFDCIRMNKIL